jgi:hypothetical protein
MLDENTVADAEDIDGLPMFGKVRPYGFGPPALGFDMVDDGARFGGVAAEVNENLRASLGERDGGCASDAAQGPGDELTEAGQAFLVHARVDVSESAEAVRAARRAARPEKEVFSVGFLTGQEVDWLPRVTRILRAELPKIEFKVTSMFSPDVAEALQNGKLDLGFMPVEPKPDVTFVVIAKEPIVVIRRRWRARRSSDSPISRSCCAKWSRATCRRKGSRSRQAIVSRPSPRLCRWSHRSAVWRSCQLTSRRYFPGRWSAGR